MRTGSDDPRGTKRWIEAKAGLHGLVRSLAVELAPAVSVNAICPGWVATDMSYSGLDAMGPTREAAYDAAMSFVPMGRMSEPAEIAGTVAWLVTRTPAAEADGAMPGARLKTSATALHAAKERINFTTAPDDKGTPSP